jgi:hypothetical protein
MNIQNRQHLLAVIAGIGVVALVGDQALFTPLAKAWKARSERLAKLRQLVSDGQNLLALETTIRQGWDSMRTNTLAAEISVAESQVLKAFDRWSQDSGVSISSIRPQWKRNADDSTTLECRADAFGTLSSLTRFLYLIEQDPMALKLDAIELTARDSATQQLNLGIQISGLILNAPGS